uniref:Protein Wnt n=1 Tax=Romanomermis culicivorax TaxID=13658 RepID=A0A915IJ94_ROMCU
MTYKWDGCSDNLDHGYAFSVDWVNAPSKGHHRKRQNDVVFSKNHHQLPLKQKINLHNSEVGRKIVAQNLEQKCRCHGVSMSCSLKSCYKILKPIKNISIILLAKYSLAKEVKEIRVNNGLMRRKSDHTNHHYFNNYRYNNQHQQQQNNRIVETFEHVAYSKISDDDLVYSKKSPDYCSPNLRLGSLGTVGRLFIEITLCMLNSLSQLE